MRLIIFWYHIKNIIFNKNSHVGKSKKKKKILFLINRKWNGEINVNGTLANNNKVR